jgi:hypothetical protein
MIDAMMIDGMMTLPLPDGLVVTILPEVMPILDGLDPESIAAQVHALIRRYHEVPHQLEGEASPCESASVHGARRQRGRRIRIEIGYTRDQHPESRYDKSKSAQGWLTLPEGGGAYERGALGRLRTWWDHNR